MRVGTKLATKSPRAVCIFDGQIFKNAGEKNCLKTIQACSVMSCYTKLICCASEILVAKKMVNALSIKRHSTFFIDFFFHPDVNLTT